MAKIAYKLLMGLRPWWFLMETNGRREAREAVNRFKGESKSEETDGWNGIKIRQKTSVS